MDRREFFARAALPFSLSLALGSGAVLAYPNPRRRGAPPARHRIRRRLVVRTVGGRLEYVVPVDLGVGWELQYAQRVVRVRELNSDTAVVSLPEGEIERLPITREDTDDNRVNLRGSLIEPDDHGAPAIEDLARECPREFA